MFHKVLQRAKTHTRSFSCVKHGHCYKKVKKLLKAYAISLANAASNYERLGYGTEREKEFFDNYIETKSVLFEFINSL